MVVSPLFFPGNDPTAALLASLAVFASAYLMRPIGGIFFGRLGDRHGRKRALLVSVLLMGVGSLLMAFLPTYASAGIVAPILLVLARLVQGFSAGGELGGALTYVYETVGEKRKGSAPRSSHSAATVASRSPRLRSGPCQRSPLNRR